MSYFSEALQQYRTTIVNQDSDPLFALAKARDWLRRYDECELISLNNVHTLTFKSDRSTLVGQPFDDAGSFTLVYKQEDADWDCTGDMFRVKMNLDHPKLFFASMLTAATSESRLKQQILDRVQRFKERYLGDENQFAYRLGIDLGAAAHMDLLEDPSSPNFAVLRAGGKYSPGNTSVPDFDLWFSRTATPARWKFGWIEAPEFHLYKVTTVDISRCQTELRGWEAVVNTFLDPLIDLNWK